MRLLIAAHGYPPTHSAGAERRAERMAVWLARHGHDVEVLAVERVNAPGGVRKETTEQDGVVVHRLSYDLSEGDAFRNQYDHPGLGEAIAAVLTGRGFDLVHLVSGYLLGVPAIETPQRLGIPVVVTLTEFWFLCPRLNLIRRSGALCSGPESDTKCARCLLEDMRRFRMLAEWPPALQRAAWNAVGRLPRHANMVQRIGERRRRLLGALASADVVICPSDYLRAMFGRCGVDTGRFTFMRQGITKPAVARPAPARAAGAPLRVGFIGQLKAHKGVDLLVDAVERMLGAGHDVTLDLWGSETEEPDYVAGLKARTAGRPAVRWNGRYTGAFVWEVLSAIDVLVVPSRWYENSPNAILEAYEAKVPVVATNLGGMAELVEAGRTGLLFALNDAADLRTQLEHLATEPGLLESLRRNLPPVKSVDDEMRDLVGIYAGVTAERPAARTGCRDSSGS